jgi:hypothetical protein
VQRKQTVSVIPNRVDPNEIIPSLFFQDRMDFCLTTMAFDPLADKNPDQLPRHDYSMLFAILDEHLRDCEKNEKNEKRREITRLDEVLYALYSNLSAVHKCWL